jgi:hypothetical protein
VNTKNYIPNFGKNNLETVYRTPVAVAIFVTSTTEKSFMKHATKKCSARESSRQFSTMMARIKLHTDWGRLFATAKVIDRVAKGELSYRGNWIRDLANIQ